MPTGVQFEIRNEDSQTLSELDDMYRLVHIDADKSYEGTYHDLELTFKKARVVLVGRTLVWTQMKDLLEMQF